MARSTGLSLTRLGGASWFFITVDYTFGHALERDTKRFVEQAGGKVLGAVRHPLGTTDFSTYLIEAQASGAKVIGFANAGADFQNSVSRWLPPTIFNLARPKTHSAISFLPQSKLSKSTAGSLSRENRQRAGLEGREGNSNS